MGAARGTMAIGAHLEHRVAFRTVAEGIAATVDAVSQDEVQALRLMAAASRAGALRGIASKLRKLEGGRLHGRLLRSRLSEGQL